MAQMGAIESPAHPRDAAALPLPLRRRFSPFPHARSQGWRLEEVAAASGVPSFTRRGGRDRTSSAAALEAEQDQRLPALGILEHVARTAHRTGWWRRFGAEAEEPAGQVRGHRVHPPIRPQRHAGRPANEHGLSTSQHTSTPRSPNATARPRTRPSGRRRRRCPPQPGLVRSWGDGSMAAMDGTMTDAAVDTRSTPMRKASPFDSRHPLRNETPRPTASPLGNPSCHLVRTPSSSPRSPST